MKLKDIVELLKKTKKQKLSILNYCKVWKGTLTYHDLQENIVIEVKTDLPDGFYDRDNLIQSVKAKISPSAVSLEKDEFPVRDVLEDPTFSFKFTWGLLNKVKHCVSDDITQYVLKGVLFDKKNIVAIDGKRLALYPHETFGIDNEFILPSVLLKMPFEKPTIKFYVNGERNKLVIEEGDVQVEAFAVIGKYPKYSMFIPDQFNYSLTFDIEELNLVLKKMEVLKAERNRLVLKKTVFKKIENGVKVYCKNEEGEDYLFKVSGSGNFDELFVMNGKNLREMLIEKKGFVTLDFNNAESQIKVNLPNNKGTYIVMPFRVNENTVIPDRECLPVMEKDNTLF